jgi:hypothetical protein
MLDDPVAELRRRVSDSERRTPPCPRRKVFYFRCATCGLMVEELMNSPKEMLEPWVRQQHREMSAGCRSLAWLYGWRQEWDRPGPKLG